MINFVYLIQKKVTLTPINEIHAKILRDLLKNSRKSFKEIAQEAKVSQDIIGQHYKKITE